MGFQRAPTFHDPDHEQVLKHDSCRESRLEPCDMRFDDGSAAANLLLHPFVKDEGALGCN
jgi:hypothetical protein